ncbi:MAG: hypothetical protein FJZ49_07525 [Candidatus Verstraetearchaeota archaeon]|nr:hypothetical protein [Candidatus Verstraetearchaeota archaeon]
MTLLAVLAWPLMVFVFGFLPVALALMGKADVPAALKAGIIPGIIGTIMAFYFFTAAAPNYVVALILGMAGMAFLAVGFSGFVFKPEGLPTVANLVNFVGVILVILGVYVIYLFMALTEGMVAGLAVLLFGVAALASGYSVLGKFKGGTTILAVVVINFILALYLLMA